jgi:hypothetical protein
MTYGEPARICLSPPYEIAAVLLTQERAEAIHVGAVGDSRQLPEPTLFSLSIAYHKVKDFILARQDKKVRDCE